MSGRLSISIASLLFLFALSPSAATASPQPRGGSSDIKASAWVTDLSIGRGWIQGFGKVRVKNLEAHRVAATCTMTLSQGRAVVGSDSIDVTVRGNRIVTAGWGIEGGNEGGKVELTFRCRT